jgi:secreted trypsin-like serine protease
MDIALLTLAREVAVSHNLRPVCLVPPDPDVLDAPFAGYQVSGWGRTERSSSSSALLYTFLSVMPRAACQAAWQRSYPSFSLLASQLCATSEDGMDSCNGDSGGGLTAKAAGKWYLAGVVSFGTKSCDSTLPGIYTRAASYSAWLEGVISSGDHLSNHETFYILHFASEP